MNEKYYLDSYIEDGDIWTFKTSDDAVRKNRVDSTLIEYALTEARIELQNYITKNPSATAETILKNNKTGVPSWLFKGYDGDAKYTITVENISDNNKLDLPSIINTTKTAIITQLTAEFDAKQAAETSAFQSSMAKRQSDFETKMAKDAAFFIQMLERKFNVDLTTDDEIVDDTTTSRTDPDGDGVCYEEGDSCEDTDGDDVHNSASL